MIFAKSIFTSSCRACIIGHTFASLTHSTVRDRSIITSTCFTGGGGSEVGPSELRAPQLRPDPVLLLLVLAQLLLEYRSLTTIIFLL